MAVNMRAEGGTIDDGITSGEAWALLSVERAQLMREAAMCLWPEEGAE